MRRRVSVPMAASSDPSEARMRLGWVISATSSRLYWLAR